MQPTPSHRSSPSAANAEWLRVRTWPGLRGEAKLVWQWLWFEQGADRSQVITSPAAAGVAIGTSGASGRRALIALVEAGLLVIHEQRNGRWLIELTQPQHLGSLRRLDVERQAELFADADHRLRAAEEAGTAERSPSVRGDGGADDLAGVGPPARSAEVRSLPNSHPPRADHSRPLREEDLLRPSTIDYRHGLALQRVGGSERASAEPSKVSDAIAEALERLNRPAAAIAADVEDLHHLVSVIQRRVADRNLRHGVCQRIASHVLENRFPRGELMKILESLDALRRGKNLRGQSGCYFVVAVKRRFEELRIPWESRNGQAAEDPSQAEPDRPSARQTAPEER